MNLTGHWKGQYTYGQGYPPPIRGRSEPFEFEIKDEGGLFSGTCIDEVVNGMEGNESFIYGVFKEGDIKFKKTYKYYLTFNESNELIPEDHFEHKGVDYAGRLYKTFFSRKPYFKGKWSITTEYKDAINRTQSFIVEGTWKMSKAV